MIELNEFQKKLCLVIQDPLPVCPAPFAAIAESLNSDEAAVINSLQKLKSLGVIRRFSATVNYRALGKVATLVTANVPAGDLAMVVPVINALPGVSHNYLRNHKYNLWFTLQAEDPEQTAELLANLAHRLGCRFHSLSAVKIFKLRVRFDPYFPCEAFSLAQASARACDVNTFETKPATLTGIEKTILTKLQRNLEICPRPFDFLADDSVDIDTAMATITSLTDKGVIRPLSAILNHHKMGFDANAMFCACVEPERIDDVGGKLAGLNFVSHCYQRKTFQGWPYNLFAMMHTRTYEQIRRLADEFTATEKIEKFDLLGTIAELKKTPVKHVFV
ncbi:MAG: siroheme decarboxylase subunit beta [Planctomycetota bacterium]|jgi:DNA-binding Lrp family transcriptional regulator